MIKHKTQQTLAWSVRQMIVVHCFECSYSQFLLKRMRRHEQLSPGQQTTGSSQFDATLGLSGLQAF